MKDILKYDILLQWRQGFWLVYFVVTLVYLAILFNFPSDNRYFLSLMFVLTDTSVLGILFIGALVLLEKQQNVQLALWVTPLKPERYIWSKTISLALLSMVMSSLLLLLPNGFRKEFVWILSAMVMTSILYTLMGLGISSRVKTINGYMAGIMGGSVLAFLPVAPYLLLDQPFWLTVFPINAALDLVWLKNISDYRIFFDILVILFWIFVMFRFALRQYTTHILK